MCIRVVPSVLFSFLLLNPALRANPLEVESLYDGQGKFTYSVQGGDNIVWNFPPNGGFLTMKLPGAVSLITPDGWLGIMGANDMVTWRAATSQQSIGAIPVVFGVISSSTTLERFGRTDTGGQLVDASYPAAALAAQALHPSNPTAVLGYTAFEYVGPALAVVPEPATLGVLALAAFGSLAFLRRR